MTNGERFLNVAGSLASLAALAYLLTHLPRRGERSTAVAGLPTHGRIPLGALPVNEYGNVDVRRGPPAGYEHVPGARITTACKALGIECAPALVGFDKSRGRFRPETDGVVVAAADADRLRAYLADREERGKKAGPARQARAAKKMLDRERLAESLGVRSDSRTFDAFLRGEIGEEEARRIGRITSHRHEQTNYDDLLRAGYSKEDARAMMTLKGLMRLRGKTGLDGLPSRGRIPLGTAKRAINRLGRKAKTCGITPNLLREGMEIEREHRDVTGGRVGTTAKIAAAHICEDKQYYRKLKRYIEK